MAEVNITKDRIKLLGWFKNNTEWFYPENQSLLDLDGWDNYEIIHFNNYYNFLVYCWRNDRDKREGRLYKAELKLI